MYQSTKYLCTSYLLTLIHSYTYLRTWIQYHSFVLFPTDDFLWIFPIHTRRFASTSFSNLEQKKRRTKKRKQTDRQIGRNISPKSEWRWVCCVTFVVTGTYCWQYLYLDQVLFCSCNSCCICWSTCTLVLIADFKNCVSWGRLLLLL